MLRARGTPNLKEINVHILCSVVKLFLRSLEAPIIARSCFRNLLTIVKSNVMEDKTPAIRQTLLELPEPNLDTLVYLLIHLIK